MGEDYATKSDVQAVRSDVQAVQSDVEAVRTELHGLRTEVHVEIGAVRTELHGLRTEVHVEIGAVRDDIRTVGIMLERLESKVDAFREVWPTKASKTEVDAANEALSSRISAVEGLVRK